MKGTQQCNQADGMELGAFRKKNLIAVIGGTSRRHRFENIYVLWGNYLEIFIDLLIKIVPGIIAAFLASRWSVSKFYSEKNWERKERAYEEIIHALYDLICYFRIHKEDYGQGTGLSDQRENELLQKYIIASSALSKATDIGSFYISANAGKELSKLREREQLDYYEEPKFEFFDHEYQAHKKAMDELLKIAQNDLRI